MNSLNPDVVLKTIQKGLDKWSKLSQSDRKLPENFSPKTQHRCEDSYPENGLVLKGAKADLLSDPPELSNRGIVGIWITCGLAKMSWRCGYQVL